MKPENATDENLEEYLTTDGIVIIDFWASWCGPCKRFAPIFDKSAEEHSTITHLKVDVDSNPKLSAQYNIKSIPTLMFIREGLTVGQISGAVDFKRLVDLIQQTEKLDMDHVRKKLKK